MAACSPGARWPKCRFVTAVVHGVTLVGRKSGCCTKALMNELLPDLICPTTAMRHVSCLRCCEAFSTSWSRRRLDELRKHVAVADEVLTQLLERCTDTPRFGPPRPRCIRLQGYVAS